MREFRFLVNDPVELLIFFIFNDLQSLHGNVASKAFPLISMMPQKMPSHVGFFPGGILAMRANPTLDRISKYQCLYLFKV